MLANLNVFMDIVQNNDISLRDASTILMGDPTTYTAWRDAKDLQQAGEASNLSTTTHTNTLGHSNVYSHSNAYSHYNYSQTGSHANNLSHSNNYSAGHFQSPHFNNSYNVSRHINSVTNIAFHDNTNSYFHTNITNCSYSQYGQHEQWAYPSSGRINVTFDAHSDKPQFIQTAASGYSQTTGYSQTPTTHSDNASGVHSNNPTGVHSNGVTGVDTGFNHQNYIPHTPAININGIRFSKNDPLTAISIYVHARDENSALGLGSQDQASKDVYYTVTQQRIKDGNNVTVTEGIEVVRNNQIGPAFTKDYSPYPTGTYKIVVTASNVARNEKGVSKTYVSAPFTAYIYIENPGVSAVYADVYSWEDFVGNIIGNDGRQVGPSKTYYPFGVGNPQNNPTGNSNALYFAGNIRDFTWDYVDDIYMEIIDGTGVPLINKKYTNMAGINERVYNVNGSSYTAFRMEVPESDFDYLLATYPSIDYIYYRVTSSVFGDSAKTVKIGTFSTTTNAITAQVLYSRLRKGDPVITFDVNGTAGFNAAATYIDGDLPVNITITDNTSNVQEFSYAIVAYGTTPVDADYIKVRPGVSLYKQLLTLTPNATPGGRVIWVKANDGGNSAEFISNPYNVQLFKTSNTKLTGVYALSYPTTPGDWFYFPDVNRKFPDDGAIQMHVETIGGTLASASYLVKIGGVLIVPSLVQPGVFKNDTFLAGIPDIPQGPSLSQEVTVEFYNGAGLLLKTISLGNVIISHATEEWVSNRVTFFDLARLGMDGMVSPVDEVFKAYNGYRFRATFNTNDNVFCLFTLRLVDATTGLNTPLYKDFGYSTGTTLDIDRTFSKAELQTLPSGTYFCRLYYNQYPDMSSTQYQALLRYMDFPGSKFIVDNLRQVSTEFTDPTTMYTQNANISFKWKNPPGSYDDSTYVYVAETLSGVAAQDSDFVQKPCNWDATAREGSIVYSAQGGTNAKRITFRVIGRDGNKTDFYKDGYKIFNISGTVTTIPDLKVVSPAAGETISLFANITAQEDVVGIRAEFNQIIGPKIQVTIPATNFPLVNQQAPGVNEDYSGSFTFNPTLLDNGYEIKYYALITAAKIPVEIPNSSAVFSVVTPLNLNWVTKPIIEPGKLTTFKITSSKYVNTIDAELYKGTAFAVTKHYTVSDSVLVGNTREWTITDTVPMGLPAADSNVLITGTTTNGNTGTLSSAMTYFSLTYELTHTPLWLANIAKYNAVNNPDRAVSGPTNVYFSGEHIIIKLATVLGTGNNVVSIDAKIGSALTTLWPPMNAIGYVIYGNLMIDKYGMTGLQVVPLELTFKLSDGTNVIVNVPVNFETTTSYWDVTTLYN